MQLCQLQSKDGKKNKPTDTVTSKNNTNEIIIKRKSTYQIHGCDYPNSCAKVSQRKEQGLVSTDIERMVSKARLWQLNLHLG